VYSEKTSFKQYNRITLLISLVALLVFFSGATLYWFYTVEDAYISFRYCDNMLQGKGLLFNQEQPVEGYTNFLWIMLISIPRLLMPFPLAAKVPGLILGAILLLLISRSVDKTDPRASSTAALIVAACPGIQMWSVAGLETILFTVCLAAGFLASRKETTSNRLLTGLCFGFATLTRPEGVLFFSLFILAMLILKPGKPVLLLEYIIGFSVIVIPHQCFRLIYYNAWVPNTFWVKSKRFQGSGMDYFIRYAAMTGVFTAPLAIAGLFTTSVRRKILPLVLMSAGYLVYVFAVGGDWMPYGRFLIPVIPLLAMAAGISVFAWKDKFRVIGILLLAMTVVVSTVSARYDLFRFRPTRYHDILTWETEHMNDWKKVGLWFKENMKQDRVLCTGLAGIIPYYSQLPVLDRGGLNDREIAQVIYSASDHEEEKLKVGRIILNRKPDIIMIEDRSFCMLDDKPVKKINLPVDLLGFSKKYRLENGLINNRYFAFYQRKD